MPRMHVHIGHHFFGAGNLGDDLMLAGFLRSVPPAWLEDTRLTCCTPHDARSQHRRFPQIEWLPYDRAHRANCIRRSDAWLGLGGTPFQATGGNMWLLDHLCQEAAWCRQEGVPMYYLGVGVNEASVVAYPQMRVLTAQAERLWMRDDSSLEMLGDMVGPGKATAHADLAHPALAEMHFSPPMPGVLGLVLNFEDPGQFKLDDLAALVRAADGRQVRWLAQEIRPLPGSEIQLHGRLPAAIRAQAPLHVPDYANAPSSRALLVGWDGLGAMLVSRYHAALTGAWLGARVAVFARNDKVAGAARQVGLPLATSLHDADATLHLIGGAAPVERARLRELAESARAACRSFTAVVERRPSRSTIRPSIVGGIAGKPRIGHAPGDAGSPFMSSPRPHRILFLRPDAYGDLFLFEPIPRLVRHTWPHAEVGVLIRKSHEDAVALFEWDGIRILTTDCNPYREGPDGNPAAVAALRETVQAFEPDCVVAACAGQTWLEAAVASFVPGVRQISLGDGLTDPLIRAALAKEMPVDWPAIYPEKVLVDPELPEWEKNLCLVSSLLGQEPPRWWPVARVPASAADRAGQILAELNLPAGRFVACAAAGTANVPIKHWPAVHYGEMLAWLERERGIHALLIGHSMEREHLESVRQAARVHGAEPALWLGQDGEMPVMAGLLSAAQFYFGNDTGAMHLAAALGRPVASIFGGGTWPRFLPVAQHSLNIVQPLPCFGCAWDCHFVDGPCVRTIAPASVQQALERFLEENSAGETIFEAAGLEAGTRALIDAATPKLAFIREDSADRLRQIIRLTAEFAASEADRAALLDQIEGLRTRLQASESDHTMRLHQLEVLSARLQVSDVDRTGRLDQIKALNARLQASEEDRTARLTEIEDLGTRLQTSEEDRTVRLAEIETLNARLQASEEDRTARLAEVGALNVRLQISEEDRTARLTEIEELGMRLQISEEDRTARLAEVGALNVRLQTSEEDRTTRLEQIEALNARLQTSEEDRTARLTEIEELGTRLQTSEEDRTTRLEQIEALNARLQTSEEDRTARLTEIEALNVRLQTSEEDRTTRLEQIEALNARLQTSEEDRTARLAEIEELGMRLQTSEEDRTARLAEIEALNARLQASEEDRTARLTEIEELGMRLQISEEDRTARLAEVGALNVRLQTSEEDRTTRLEQIEALNARLQTSEEDRTARLTEIKALNAHLQASEADRTARLTEIEELGMRLQTSEEDRTARLNQIQELNARLQTSEMDGHERLLQLEEMSGRLQTSEEDRTARLAQIAELDARLQASEADRTARLEQIEELGTRLQASEADRATRLNQLEDTGVRLQASEAESTGRLQQIEGLNARLQASEAESGARLDQIKQLTVWLQASEADRNARLDQIEQLTAWLQATRTDHAALAKAFEEPASPAEEVFHADAKR